MNADRHLLFGLLALQNEFIDKRQLVAGFGVWIADRRRSLDSILLDHGAIEEAERALVAGLVDRHIANRGGNVAASLQSLTQPGSIREELECLADSYLQASVAKLRPMEFVTALPSVGQSTSANQRFEIRRPLDRGGLGIVSVAIDRELNREVALKEIRDDRADDQSYRTKFLLEAEVTGGLEHPGIIPVYGLGVHRDGRPYYAMRLIKGDNFGIHIKRFHASVASGAERFDGQGLKKLLRRLLDVCHAVEYAHTRGVLHRDLKPENVMLGRFGETLVVDWGLAKPRGAQRHESEDSGPETETKLIPSGGGSDMTIAGSIVGTASYAPPEQLSGDLNHVDERSDVYSLGAMLYELLTSKPPAQGNTLEAIIKSSLAGDFKTPRELQPQVPRPLEAICRKALQRQRHDRYATAAEFCLDIERWLDDLPVSAYPEPSLLRARRWIKRHPALVATSALLVLSSTLGLALFSSYAAQKNRELDRRNLDLDKKNMQLVAANERAAKAIKEAEKQSQLAFSTLTSVVVDAQQGLKNLPGSSEVRRRLLGTSISQLDRIASEYLSKNNVDRTTLNALEALGDVVLKFDAADDASADAPHEQQQAVEVAKSLYLRALQVAEHLAKQSPSSIASLRDLASCYQKVGDVSLQQGKVGESLGYYQKSLSIHRNLIETNPSDTSARRDLSSSLERLGELSLTSGQVQASAGYFDESLQLREKLAKENASDAQAQRDLAESYRDVGDKNLRLGETRAALGYYKKTFEISQQLASEDPKSRKAMRSLAMAYVKLGDAQLQLRSADQAMDHFQKSLNIRIQLSEADPSDVTAKRNLSASYHRLGSVSLEAWKTEEAIRYFEKAIEISETIAASHSSDALSQRELSNLYSRLGDANLSLNRSPRATELYQKGLAIRELLASGDLTNARAQDDVASSYWKLGDAARRMGDLAGATQHYQMDRDIRMKLATANPLERTAQRELALSLARIGDLKLELGQARDAALAYKKAFDIRQSLLTTSPEDLQVQRELSTSYNQIGDTYLSVAQYQGALTAYLKSLEIRERLAAASAADPASARDLSLCHRKVGDAKLKLKDFEGCRAAYETSQQILRRLSSDDANDILSLKEFAQIHASLSRYFVAANDHPSACQALKESIAILQSLMARSIETELLQNQVKLLEAELKKHEVKLRAA